MVTSKSTSGSAQTPQTRKAHNDVVQREAVALLVRRRREELGLTVRQAADRAGIGKSTWTNIESATPPMKRGTTLGKVANALDLHLADILDAAGMENVPDDRGEVATPTDTDKLEALLSVIGALRFAADEAESQLRRGRGPAAHVVRRARLGTPGIPGPHQATPSEPNGVPKGSNGRSSGSGGDDSSS